MCLGHFAILATCVTAPLHVSRCARAPPQDWLRSRVGLVAQTPTLFASSIFANIALVGWGWAVSRGDCLRFAPGLPVMDAA